MRGCVQFVQVLQAFMSAPRLTTPTNFFLGLAFSGPLSSPHAYATRACPTLGWPLSAYKPACAFLYTLQIRQLLVAFVSANFCLVLPFLTPSTRSMLAACLLNPRPAFVFLQALHFPRATLQPSWRMPIVSVRLGCSNLGLLHLLS